MAENIGALYGRLPDAALRRRMAADAAALQRASRLLQSAAPRGSTRAVGIRP
jgi:hypothetical protein